jgi:hypothetical protein
VRRGTMLAIVAPLLAFLTVPNGEGDEFAAMRAAAEAGLPSNAAGPQRESRTVLGTASNTCSDTPGWTNPHGWGCAWYDALWCAGGSYRPGQAFALGKRFGFPESHCCSCGKGELDEIYQQRLTPVADAAFAAGVASVDMCQLVNAVPVNGGIQPECIVEIRREASLYAAELYCGAAGGTWDPTGGYYGTGSCASGIDAAFEAGAASVSCPTASCPLTQADVDAAYANGAASVTPEDGVTQADVDEAIEQTCTGAGGTFLSAGGYHMCTPVFSSSCTPARGRCCYGQVPPYQGDVGAGARLCYN